MRTSIVAENHLMSKEDAGREAGFWLRHAFGVSEVELILKRSVSGPLKIWRLARFLYFIAQRGRGVPAAYLLGKKSFYGREFTVNRAVLIPRPASETMIDVCLPVATECDLVVDVGTGSGALGITLALECKRPVVMTDCSRRALRVARKNWERLRPGSGAVDNGEANDSKTDNEWVQSVRFLPGNLLAPLAGPEFTLPNKLLVIANLPYLKTGALKELERSVRREPSLALDGGADGLELYRKLLDQLKEMLGRKKIKSEILDQKIFLAMECDPEQIEKLIELVKGKFSMAEVVITKDCHGLDRVVSGWLT